MKQSTSHVHRKLTEHYNCIQDKINLQSTVFANPTGLIIPRPFFLICKPMCNPVGITVYYRITSFHLQFKIFNDVDINKMIMM